MTDAQKRIVFCNDRYLEIYGLSRSDIPPGHDRPGTAGAAARSAASLDVSVEDFYAKRRQPGRPRHRTARRAVGSGQIFRAAERRLGRRRMRIAASSASCRGNSHRPSSSWNWCSTTCRSASPPRASRTAATFSPTARSSASRAFPATTSSASAPTRSSSPKPRRASRRPTGRRSIAPEGQSPQRIRGRARLEEARSRLQSRDRAQRKQPAGIPDRAVRRRHRPPIAVAGARKHQEVPRTGGRQHSGLADRRARQRRTISARQSQRRDHPQPPARGCHRPDGRRYLQSAAKPS